MVRGPLSSPRAFDPLRYGLRALDEMAREQASVAPPPRITGEVFAPHPILRSSAPDGAALSLRLFSDSADDATDFVLGAASQLRLEPIPARAAPLFEAHATYQSVESDESLTLGFPLVTYVQQGTSRAAPLFSVGGARATWTVGDTAWRLPRAARDGVPMTLPTALVLELDEEASYGIHGGVWHYLFGLDGGTLASVARASRYGLGALVRAATRALELGGEGESASEVDLEAPPEDTSDVTARDLDALTLAASRRAPPSRGLRAFPHGIAMLPPRGDPTSSLRTDLRALLDDVAPARGPLAVYLGAPAAPPHDSPVWSCGRISPTSSQLAAARAFEGSSDLVSVCGPPGCGKTALLHVVAAQTVVACALSGQWDKAPRRSAPWPLVVTSTNNAAVDHALAPFVGSPEIPLALRLGNRRSLAEVTANALATASAALSSPGVVSLERARAAFEDLAKPVRAAERDRVAAAAAERERLSRRGELDRRAAALRTLVARAEASPVPLSELDVSQVDAARSALAEHAEAADALVRLHLEGARASVERACEKWSRANEIRSPRFASVLSALGIALPCGPLDASRARESAESQGAALRAALGRLDDLVNVLALPSSRAELLEIEAELRRAPTPASLAHAPSSDLYEAALLVRDAWAREHRQELSKRLTTALGAVGDGRGARAKPLPQALLELAPLFPIAGCTLLSMRTSFPLDKEVVDRLVVDEAAQCAPVYAVPALARARRAMFTGDTAQLPPVYTLDPRVDERLAKGLDTAKIQGFRMSAEAVTSAQAVAEPRARAHVTLVEHFRSQRPIVELASRWSGYSLDVRTEARSLSDVSSRLVAPVVAIGVSGRGERAPEGVVNEAEVAVAVGLVEALLRDGILPSDLAVLTPFVGQCARIERELFARGHVQRGGVLVSTVHRLQGGERRVVVFSVAATARRHLRWLAERPHLLHVATSRARDHLVVLVDPDAALGEPALSPIAEQLSRSAPWTEVSHRPSFE